MDYGLWSAEGAESALEFLEEVRSFVINYSIGHRLVREHVETRGGGPPTVPRSAGESSIGFCVRLSLLRPFKPTTRIVECELSAPSPEIDAGVVYVVRFSGETHQLTRRFTRRRAARGLPYGTASPLRFSRCSDLRWSWPS